MRTGTIGIGNTLSVFFNPSAASDMMVEAAIKDILEKLKRGAELLEAGAIATPVLPVNRSSSIWNFFSSTTSPVEQSQRNARPVREA